MIRPKLKTFPALVMAWAAVVMVSGLAGLAQTSTSATGQTATTPETAQRTSSSAQLTAPANHAFNVPVTVLEDTLIRVMTTEPLNSKRAAHGTPILFTVSEDVVVGDVLAIPRGAMVHGMVIKSKNAGVLTGSNEIALKLVSLDLGERSYPLYTYQFKVEGASKTRPTETKAVRGAYVGAIVGGLAGSPSAKSGSTAEGRVASMTAGAAVGAGVGTMVSAVTPGPGVWIPSEAQVDFYLAAPITVPPASAKDAERLGQGLRPGGPNLYVRDDVH
jgi:hypothetical protein